MSGKAVLAGSLTSISLADLFQILGGNNSTGVLRIKNQYAPNPGLIYFVKGDPVNASSGSLQGIDAIYSLFGWTDGKFAFDQQAVKVQHVVKQNRMEIVLDALRRLDDGVIKKMGPPSFDEVPGVEIIGNKHGGRGAPQITKGQFVDYSHVLQEEDYGDGQRIVKEGGHGKWIWVILEGTVIMAREMATGPLPIARLGEGCFIGTTSALSFLEYTRSATATASGAVRLGLLDTERLSREYASLSSKFRGLLLSLDGRLRKVTDRVVELSMNQDKTRALTQGKKVVIKRGSSKQDVFTITDGEACVVGLSKRGHLALLQLQKGDFLGYVPFMDVGHEPRAASVMAVKDIKVTKLDLKSIQKEYDNVSATFRNLIYNAVTFVFRTTKMAYHLHQKK